MALVDPTIYQRYNGPSLFRGLADGLGKFQSSLDAHQQRKAMETQRQQQEQAQMREASFRQNLNGLLSSYGEYAHTPEGQRGLFADMSKAGFGREMMGLMGGMPEMPKPPALPPDSWDPLTGAESPTLYNKRTGEIKATGVAGKPAKPEAPKKYQPVKNKAGKVVGWDPETGLGMDGQPVEFWQEPKAASKPEGLKPEQVFAQEQQLRNSFQNKTKDFRDVRDAYGRIQVSAKEPSAAGDLALIFNYMKMLDPGSTVRESEFAAAAASGSLGDRFVAAGKKLLSGERLDPTQRADFVKSARDLYGKQLRQYDKAKFETRKMASAYPGLNPDRILMDDGLADEPAQQPQGMPTFEQYDALPSGAEFTDPEGNVRRKP